LGGQAAVEKAVNFLSNIMSSNTLANVAVNTQANVYFDGKCVSHSLTMADGARKSVGVILPSKLTFNTGAAEVMELVTGSCKVLLPGASAWQAFVGGQQFSVPANAKFEIEVTETLHYVCHFG
jgi:purine/pyrimidine-nucleoside phosphorylase